jgi:hypothetical protein
VGSLAKTRPRNQLGIQIAVWNQLFNVKTATEMLAAVSEFGPHMVLAKRAREKGSSN